MRSLRAAILQVLQAEFVDFARSKGLPRRVILVQHVLRNAMLSTVTLVGLHVGALLGGAVITESVFAVPGVGRLMVDSIFARDYPVIQALTLVLAVIVSLAFLTDRPRADVAGPASRALRRLPAPDAGGRGGPAGAAVLRGWRRAWWRPTIPLAFDFAALLQPPTAAHPFGTDQFGQGHPIADHLGGVH